MNTDQADTSPEEWIGARFRELRKERGWSQEDLAKHMAAYGRRWSQATVTRLEAATRPIRLNEVADLAVLFGLKLADMLAGAPAGQSACPACGCKPPAGFTCNACGKSGTGTAIAKSPAKKPALTEVYGVKITGPMARYLIQEHQRAPGEMPLTRDRNWIATETALEQRGLMMKPGNAGPGGCRLTDKGKMAAQLLAGRFQGAESPSSGSTAR